LTKALIFKEEYIF